MDSKARIFHKAQELFKKYGIRSVSMDDIASQLGISKKTVYQYYTDKNELVDEVFTSIINGNKENCLHCREHGQNPIDEVFRSFDMVKELLAHIHPSVLYDLMKYHPGTYKKFDDYRNEFLLHIIKENLEEGKRQGLYREDIDTDILARLRLHSVLLSFDSKVFPTNHTDLLYIEQQILENFLFGVATVKGQKLIQKYKNRSKANEEA